MPTYSYKAITPAGVSKDGVLDAASEALVVESLHAQGLIPVKIMVGKAIGADRLASGKKSHGLFASRKVSQEDIMALVHQAMALGLHAPKFPPKAA